MLEESKKTLFYTIKGERLEIFTYNIKIFIDNLKLKNHNNTIDIFRSYICWNIFIILGF